MKKLIFICTLLGVSNFGLDTTYGMNNQTEHNIEPYNIIVNDVDTNSDDDSSDNLDPYATMYRNTTGRLTEAEIHTFTNMWISSMYTALSFLMMGGRIFIIGSNDDGINAENHMDSMINKVLIFTGIGIATNIALRYLRPNMTDYNRRHNCLLLYLLFATTYAVWSENSNALTTEATLDDLGLFISAQSMYGLAALGGFFLGEALHCE